MVPAAVIFHIVSFAITESVLPILPISLSVQNSAEFDVVRGCFIDVHFGKFSKSAWG